MGPPAAPDSGSYLNLRPSRTKGHTRTLRFARTRIDIVDLLTSAISDTQQEGDGTLDVLLSRIEELGLRRPGMLRALEERLRKTKLAVRRRDKTGGGGR
jgi:hypothetical protein